MADNSQRTEQPTPRRLEKARKDGDFPAAREFVGALQFFAFISLAAAYFPDWIVTVQNAMATGLRQAFSSTLTAGDLVLMLNTLAGVTLRPLAVLGGVLM